MWPPPSQKAVPFMEGCKGAGEGVGQQPGQVKPPLSSRG